MALLAAIIFPPFLFEDQDLLAFTLAQDFGAHGGVGNQGLADLNGAALIREVHVYGQSLAVGAEQTGSAQHSGLGTRLLAEAEQIAMSKGYKKMAVISAIGTRKYYMDRGFERGELYLIKQLESPDDDASRPSVYR